MVCFFRKFNAQLLSIIVVILLVNGCAGLKGRTRLTPEQKHEEALSLFKEGAELLNVDSLRALEKFDAAAEADPTFYQAFYNAGVALEAMGKLKEAAKRYESCLAIDKEQGSCLSNLLLVWAQDGELKKAADLSQKYLNEYPDKDFASTAAAELAIFEKDFSRAEKLARAVIERNAENIPALFVMARVFYEQKQFSAAKWVLKNALELAPSDGELFLLLGHVNQALSLLHDALDDYAMAAKFHPTEDTLSSYGLLLLRRGRVKESLPIFLKLTELRPDIASNYLNLGNSYLANQAFDEAKSAYLKASELDPHFNDVNFNMGLLYFNLKPKDLPEMDRLKTSQTYFKNYLEKAGVSTERAKEVENYLGIIQQKIELLEYAIQAEKEAKEEEERTKAEAEKAKMEEEKKPESAPNDALSPQEDNGPKDTIE